MAPLHNEYPCVEFRLYYYDWLREESRVKIPEHIREHISRCPRCQSEICRLDSMLSEAKAREGSGEDSENSYVLGLLSEHFGYVDKLVDCLQVKPFLPKLADALLEIKVPSPITAHIDKCEACTKDLRSIRELGLTHEQLCSLSDMFSDTVFNDPGYCRQVREVIASVGELDFEGIAPALLKHVSTCSNCSESLLEHRERKLSLLSRSGSVEESFVCKSVKPSELFDYCFPFGISTGRDGNPELRSSVASHVVSCPVCLSKMQQLHRTISGIASRGASGVLTRFAFRGQEEPVQMQHYDIYDDWQIDVQVFEKSGEHSEAVSPASEQKKSLKDRLAAVEPGRFVKPMLVSAAVMMIGFALFLSPATARAIDLAEVYKALSRINSVCIKDLIPSEEEPIQTEWISRNLNVRLFKTGNSMALWDLNNSALIKKDLKSGEKTITELSPERVSKFRDLTERAFGLVPIDEFDDIPEGAQWRKVPEKALEKNPAGTEVYDLLLDQYSGRSVRHLKGRFFIDIETKLPKRVKWYSKLESETEYDFDKTVTASYVSDSEISGLIQKHFRE